MPKKIICTVPERVCTSDQLRPVEQALSEAYRKHFGGDQSVVVLWCGLPEGQSYVAGVADEVFILMFEVEDGLDASRREAAMMDINRGFAGAFGVSAEKPLVSALDSATVGEYLRRNRNRLQWHRRPGFLVATLWHVLWSRRNKGFAAIRANL